MIPEKIVKHEKNIVWLVDPRDYPWVREDMADFCQKQGISKSRQSQIEKRRKLIGYADLEDNAPPSYILGTKKHYFRRVFVVRDGDYQDYKYGHPAEGVDPLTVQPKVKGAKELRFP
jgi:hypothetical protein